jgi:hypothetical protein
VGPKAGLDDLEKRKFLAQPGLELLPLGLPARSQSLLNRGAICTLHLTLTRVMVMCNFEVFYKQW